mgnify:CR=1 FL=1
MLNIVVAVVVAVIAKAVRENAMLNFAEADRRKNK